MTKFQAVAIIERAAQVAEYKWETWSEALCCDESTTIKDLHSWIKNRTGFSGPHCLEIKIVFAEVFEGNKNKPLNSFDPR